MDKSNTRWQHTSLAISQSEKSDVTQVPNPESNTLEENVSSSDARMKRDVKGEKGEIDPCKPCAGGE